MTEEKHQPFKGKSRYKRKTPKTVEGVHVRREKDQTLAPLLAAETISDKEIDHLHRGPIGEVVIDDYFYDIVRRLVHFGAIYETDIFRKLRIGSDIWAKKKKEHPELMLRIDQYIADRDLLIQAYATNILFDPNHKDHTKMLMHHDKMKYMREAYRLRSQEWALRAEVAKQQLDAARLSQPNFQIAVLPAQENAIAKLSPDELMARLTLEQQPAAIEAAVITEEGEQE